MDEHDYLEEIHKLNRELAEFKRGYFRLEDENKRLKEKIQEFEESSSHVRTGICQECQKPFTYPALGRKRKFCSNICRQKNHRWEYSLRKYVKIKYGE